MGNICPNYNHPEYKRLVGYFNGDESQAKRVFIAQGYAIPEIPTINQIKEDLKFNGGILSEMAKAMLLKRIENYNVMHGTSHRAKTERVSPTSYKAKLTLNFMPTYEPSAYNQSTLKTLNTINSDVEVETVLAPSDIIMKEGNEYIVNGEVYPSYEDAYNSIYNEDKSGEFFQLRGSKDAPNKELDNFLVDFLKQYNIKVEYINNFKERFNIDGIATADILNKTIYVAKDKADSTTLPEEAAHFIIEMLGEDNALFKAMAANIKETSEYSQVVEEYGSVYKGDEVKLKKEAMAKVLLTYFIQRSQSKEALPIKTLNIFERVWNWFKKFFGKMNNELLQQKINDAFGTVANQVFEGTIKLDPNRLSMQEMFYQLDTAKKNVLKAVKKLEEHARVLERRAVNPGQEKHADTIKANIEIIRKRIENENIKDGILGLLSHGVEYELKVLRDTLDKIKSNPDKIVVTSQLVNQLQDVIELYTDLEGNIQSGINEDEDLKEWADKEVQGIFAEIRKDLSIGRVEVKKLMEKRVRAIIEEIKHPDSTYDINELLDSKVGDISGFTSYLAPLHSVNDEVLRMVYKVVQDIFQETHYLTVNEANQLKTYQLEMEKSGFKDMSVFHERDKDGKKTGYLLSEFKWGEYNQALEQTKVDIVNGLNKLGMTLEYYSDLNKDNLDEAQRKVYNALWKQFGDKYMKKGEPNPPVNPEFDKLMRKPLVKQYYDYMFKLHVADKDRLPKMYRMPSYYYLVPQIEKDVMQVILGSRDTLNQNLKDKLKETYKFSSSDQEVGDNKTAIDAIAGKGNKLVPIYFVKPLENKELLSDDFTSMYAHFTEMTRNFRALTTKLDDLFLIQQAMGERQIKDSTGKVIKPEGTLTNSYKMMEDFMKQHIFKDYAKLEYNINGKKYNVTKIVKNTLGYVRGKNLFGAMFTMGSGYVKASIDSTIEDVIGTVTNKESKFWAEGEFDKNIIYLIGNINKRNKTTKVEVFFENAGVFGGINSLFNRMDVTGRLGRMTKDQIIYGGYELIGVRVKGKLALSVYDNYRLVDGKFIRKDQYKKQMIAKHGEKEWATYEKEWSKYRDKSLYNAFEVKGNQWLVKEEFKPYVDSKLISTVNGIIEQRSATIDGRLHNLEKAGIYNNLLGQAVMMHRGWLVSGAVERFKKGGINYITGEYEEGYYNTVAKFMTDLIKTHKANIFQARAMWSKLEPWQKRNMMRMTVDLAFTVLAYTLFSILQGMADDDDDWYLQAMAYQATRIFMEQTAFINPLEAMNMLNSPSAGLNLLKDVTDFGKSFINNDIIDYGPYKGKHKMERSLWRITYLKNLYELQAPQFKNKFIKSQIL